MKLAPTLKRTNPTTIAFATIMVGLLATPALAQSQPHDQPQDPSQTLDQATVSPRASTAPITAIDAAIHEAIAAHQFPGAVCIAGVVTRNADGQLTHQLLHESVLGATTWTENAPPTQFNTLYDLASVSKLVGTTSASLVLLGDGQLTLETPAARWLDGFSPDITIRHLMAHTSGLPAYADWKSIDEARATSTPDAIPQDALFAAYAELPRATAPGDAYRYSCVNFQTLAAINQKALSSSQEAFLIDRVFGPLHMPDTRYTLTDEQRARTAPTYRDADGAPVSGTVHDPLARYHQSAPYCPGNAGLYGTAPDLARWCRMVLSGGRVHPIDQLVDPDVPVIDEAWLQLATLRQTAESTDESRGLGFDIYESEGWLDPTTNREPGHHVVGHTGYTGTLVLIDQHTGAYLVLLTNRTFPHDPQAIDQTPSINDVRKAVWQIVREHAGDLQDATAPMKPITP